MLPSFLWGPGSSFEGFYRWYQIALFGIGFLALAAYHREQPTARKYLLMWAIVGVQGAYLAFSLFLQGRPIDGGFVNPNYFASFLLVGFSIGLAVALFHREQLHRTAGAAVALAFFFGITQAWSRGATLAALGAAALATIRYARHSARPRLLTAVVLAAMTLAGAAASPALVQKFTDSGARDPYNYLRPKIWLAALQIVRANPVFGIGLDQFRHVSKQYTPAVEGTVARYPKRPGIAHSEYLQYAAEVGLPAVLLLGGLAASLFLAALRRAPTCSRESRPIQEAAILTAASLAIHALVDNNWTTPVMASGLVIFSLGDVLPDRRRTVELRWSSSRMAFAVMAVLLMYAHSTLIPAVGLWFNETGHRALAAGNLEKAELAHRLAVAIVPDHPVFLDNMGAVYLKMYEGSREQRLLDLAEHFYTRAMKSNPNDEAPARHVERVLIQRLTGNREHDLDIHERIVEVDRETLRRDPFNPFVRKNLAEALYNSGKREEAERELATALSLEPNYIPAYLRFAEWELEQGNEQEGESYRRKAIEIATKYHDFEATEVYEALLLGRPESRISRQ